MKLIELIETIKHEKLKQLCENGIKLPKTIAKARKNNKTFWVVNALVPNIRGFHIADWLHAIAEPESMFKDIILHIEKNGITETIDTVCKLVGKYGLNKTTFDEAVGCYKNGLYTSCTLDIFALIDSIYLSNQLISGKRRMLPHKIAYEAPTRFLIDNKEFTLFIVEITTEIVSQLYSDGNNFMNEKPKLNRNFISHGMNQVFFPDKLTCEKLFILLYNLLILFDTGWLKLDLDNSEDKNEL